MIFICDIHLIIVLSPAYSSYILVPTNTQIDMNILVSNAFEQQEAVMIFTEKYTVDQIKDRLTAQNIPFDDIYEVADKDIQYFIYEPLWI